MKRVLFLLLALGIAAGKASAQEREWALDASEQEAYLIFGVADSEDVGVSLWCPAKKGVVNLFLPRPTEELRRLGRNKVPLTIRAGKETATFAGKVEIASGAVNSSVEVEIPASHPLFPALETADRFSVSVDGNDVVFPLFDANVSDLLDICRKG